jgi:DNA-directed RNA polymerase I, II, and III subunit RPABC2
MPPKPKKEEDYSDDDAVDLQPDEDEDDEFIDDDYQEDSKVEHRKKDEDEDKSNDEDELSDDDLPADSDIEDDASKDLDIVEYMDEDDIEPPVPEIIRNYMVIKPENRTTSERLSNFECARVLGERARHIDNGATPYIDTSNFTSSLEIAYTELVQKRIPMAVIRYVGHNSVEIWRLRDMIIPKLPPSGFFIH